MKNNDWYAGYAGFCANSQLSASGKTEIYTDTPFTGADNDQFQPTGTVVSKTEGGATEANKYSGKTTATVDENLTPSTEPTPTEQEVTVTKVEITGMTGDSDPSAKNTTDDTPVVGDTLKAVTTPANAKVTYQWYSDAAADGTFVAIPGATSATYTVKAADFGAGTTNIRVVIAAVEGSKTTVSPVATEAVTAEAVCRNIADYAKITLQPDDATTTTINESIPTIDDTYTVTVSDKTSSTGAAFGNINTEYTAQWYLDSVSSSKKLTDAQVGDADVLTITPAATSTSKLIGHKLIVVLTGKADAGYLGTVQAETKPVQADLAGYNITVENEAGDDVTTPTPVQVGEKMKASIATLNDTKATVTWQWILDYNTPNAQVLSTTDSYTLTKAVAEKIDADGDGTADSGEKTITIIAKGTGNYVSSKMEENMIDATMVSVGAPELSVTISNEDTAQLGSPLTAAVSPAAYSGNTYVTYQWYKNVAFDTGTDGTFLGGDAISGATSASYTPPKDSESTTFGVKITAKSNAVTVASGTYGVTVGAPISGATITVTNTTAAAAGRTQNIVDDELTVSAVDGVTDLTANTEFTVEWYKNSVSSANKLTTGVSGTGDSTYTLQEADYVNNNTIIAVVVGKAPYSGKAQASKTFGNIYLAAAAAATLDISAPSIGDTITATVTTPNPEDYEVTYQWYRLTAAQAAALEAADANGKTLTAAQQLAKVKAATILTGETNKTYTATVDDYNMILACVVKGEGCVAAETFATTTTKVPAPENKADLAEINTVVFGDNGSKTTVTVTFKSGAEPAVACTATLLEGADSKGTIESIAKDATEAVFTIDRGTLKGNTTYTVVVTPKGADDTATAALKALYKDATATEKTDPAEFASATFSKSGDTLEWTSTDVKDQYGNNFKLTGATATAETGARDVIVTLASASAGNATLTFSTADNDGEITGASINDLAVGDELTVDFTVETVSNGTALAHGDISAVTVTVVAG